MFLTNGSQIDIITHTLRKGEKNVKQIFERNNKLGFTTS